MTPTMALPSAETAEAVLGSRVIGVHFRAGPSANAQGNPVSVSLAPTITLASAETPTPYEPKYASSPGGGHIGTMPGFRSI